MEPGTPEQLHPLWVQAHNMGDLDAMMALCEPSVCFVTWSARTLLVPPRFVKPTGLLWRPSLT